MPDRRSTDATGMAGEFFVMEKLYRLGHQPALTLGQAKAIDILVRTKSGNLYEVSVKAVRGGGKWGVGKDDLSSHPNLVFVFLHYRDFKDLSTNPEVFVLPASAVEDLKHEWIQGQYAVYFTDEESRQKLESYREAWDKYIV